MTRFLHVANGSATTSKIEAAGIPGRLSIWADPLYEGPVPGDVTDGGLLDIRARYLSGLNEESQLQTVKGLQQWRDAIARVDAYDELVLWYEHDLFDQLNLLQLLSWIKGRLPAGPIVSLVEIGSFPDRPDFKGLGELTPNQLAPLLESRQPVSAERYGLALRAWKAFKQSSPEMLVEVRRADTSAMPFLKRALERFLEEYPWLADGLSRTERRLLEIAAEGPVDVVSAFVRMHEGESAYYITDLSFLGLLRKFSRCDPPLVSVGDADLEGDRIPDGQVTITADGKKLLKAEMDWIATYGIDRWLGGVHLAKGQTLWRWNPATSNLELGTWNREPRT